MNKAIAFLTLALLTGATLGAAATTASASNKPSMTFYIDARFKGPSKVVAAPDQDECVPLAAPFPTQSAENDTKFTAELFYSTDCAGKPNRTIYANNSKSRFRRPILVRSVRFTA